jgi:hypothetical protein
VNNAQNHGRFLQNIGKADSLDFVVWGRQQVQSALTLLTTDHYPVAHWPNSAAGLTIAEMQMQQTHKFSRFVNKPNVIVRVANPTSQVFYVLGEVKGAGKHQLGRSIPSQVVGRNWRAKMTVNYKVVSSDADLSADVRSVGAR